MDEGVFSQKWIYATIMDKNFETTQKVPMSPLPQPTSSPLFDVEEPENIADSTLKRGREGLVFVADPSYIYNSLFQ